jgi:hypothetical protein
LSPKKKKAPPKKQEPKGLIIPDRAAEHPDPTTPEEDMVMIRRLFRDELGRIRRSGV